METKDDDAIQMIEDSIESIKGLDGYKEDEGTSGPVGAKGVQEIIARDADGNPVPIIGNNEVSRNNFTIDIATPIPAPGPIDPRPAQTDNSQRWDHVNDLMRGMRLEMEKREKGEARRVSDVVEQVGNTDGCTQKHYKDHYRSDKRVKFAWSNNTSNNT